MLGTQFSAYDERPDPKKPGQQGTLFRKEAPARGTPDERRGIQRGTDWMGREQVTDTRITEKGRVRGIWNEMYHGTAAKLKPGSLIKPGMPANFEPGPNDSGTKDRFHEHVFATPELHNAHLYARLAQEKRGNRSARAHVYRVQPTGPVQSDPETDRTLYDPDYNADYDDYSEAPEELSMPQYQSKQPMRVLSEVQFPEHQEAYRRHHEDELGKIPGSYPYSPKISKADFREIMGYDRDE